MSAAQMTEVRAHLRAALEVLSEIGVGEDSRTSSPVAPDDPDIAALLATVERQREALERIAQEPSVKVDSSFALRACVTIARAALSGEPPQDREGKSGADTSEGALTPAVAVPSRSIIAAPPGALTREGLAASTSASPNSATVVDPPEAAE